MTDKETLASANDAILEEPISFKVDVNPRNWLHKLMIWLKLKPKKITLTIKPTVLGARVMYSRALINVEIGEKELDDPLVNINHRLTVDYTYDVAKAIACAIHNKNNEPPKWLVNTILENFTASDLHAVMQILKNFINPEVFLNSIISIKGMSLNEKEEIIASTSIPGKQ